MGVPPNNHDMEEGTLEIGMGEFRTDVLAIFYLLLVLKCFIWLCDFEETFDY